jgi:O-antigen/teichoic acid export membrane protein
LKLIKTSLYSAISTFIRIISGFVANKIVAIITGPSGVALIGQFTNFVAIILTISNGAINTGVVKYTAEYEGDDNKLKKLFSTSLIISTICSVFFGLILFVSSDILSTLILKDSIYKKAIKILGVTIIFYSLNNLFLSILNGKRQIRQYTIVNTLGSIIGLLFTLFLVYFYKTEGALYSIVLSQSIIFFITLLFVIKSNWFSLNYFKNSLDKEIIKKLSSFSLMALVSVFTAPIIQMLLREIVITKIDIDSAGYWQGMMKVSDGYLLVVTTALSTYYLPKLSALKENNDLKNEIIYGYKIIMPVVLISCMSIYFLRFIIIKILYTNDFIEMENLFLYQLLGDFFKIAAWLLAYLMLAKAMMKIYILTEILFSISHLILGYICIDWFGLKGITIAFCINYTIYFIFMICYFRKLIFLKNE